MGSELLDWNILNSNHIEHQPRTANVPTSPCSWPVVVLVGAPAADVALEEPKSRQPHPQHPYRYRY